MLMFAFTYHQVMAAFIDFVFPFGKQDSPQDFHFSGLRHEVHLSPDMKALRLVELGRSGKDFRMCYNLKSVEPSPSQPHWPWSIRQSAVYHSFDVGTGRAFWTIIKGNELLNRRIKEATKSLSHGDLSLVRLLSLAFSASLDSHLIIIDWCSESWRWYINYLDEAQESTTRRALLISFDRPAKQLCKLPQRAATSPPSNRIKRTISRFKQRAASATGMLTTTVPLRTLSPPVPPPEFEQDLNNNESFSFSDLQQVQHYQEKINEALLVLRSNMKILTNIKQYYRSLLISGDFPKEIKDGSAKQINHFQSSIDNTINDLEMQQSRAEMLLSTVTNRKNMVNI
jgi:hypothetical protein